MVIETRFTSEKVVVRLLEALYQSFGDVEVVEGLKQLIEDTTDQVRRAACRLSPEVLAQLVAESDLWLIRARDGGTPWDWREETLSQWLAAHPTARIWVSAQEPPHEEIAQWLLTRMQADVE